MVLKKFTVCSIVLLGLMTVAQVFAQTNPIFLQLGQAKGALYKPDSGPAARWDCGYASRIQLHEQHRLPRVLKKRLPGPLYEF